MLSRQPLSQGAVLGHVLRRNVRSNWRAYYLAADGLADHFGADLGAYNISSNPFAYRNPNHGANRHYHAHNHAHNHAVHFPNSEPQLGDGL